MEATKACPYCGEQILAVAIKCKHCSERLDRPPSLPAVQRSVNTDPFPKKMGLDAASGAAAESLATTLVEPSDTPERPPRRTDVRTVLGVIGASIPGLMMNFLIVQSAVGRANGRSARSVNVEGAFIGGCVLAIVLGGAAGGVLAGLVIPWAYRTRNRLWVLLGFAGAYAVTLYFVQIGHLEFALEGSGAYFRREGSGPPVFALIASLTAALSTFIGVRLARREPSSAPGTHENRGDRLSPQPNDAVPPARRKRPLLAVAVLLVLMMSLIAAAFIVNSHSVTDRERTWGAASDDEIAAMKASSLPERSASPTTSAPSIPRSPTPTKADQLRAAMSAEELSTIRAEMENAHAKRRWSTNQQERYVAICMKAASTEPSVNERVCGCTLEMLMDHYESLGSLVAQFADGRPADSETATWQGFCLAAFGTAAQ